MLAESLARQRGRVAVKEKAQNKVKAYTQLFSTLQYSMQYSVDVRYCHCVCS